LEKENYCNGNILKIPLTYRSNVPADKLIALTWQEEIKNSLKDCIDIELNGVESTTVYKNLSLGIYTAVILDWTGAYSDPEAYLTPLLSCNEIVDDICKKGESVYSGSFWGSNKVESLFLESEKISGIKRLEKLVEIEKIAANSVPYIPIWISSQKAWSQNKISKPIFKPESLAYIRINDNSDRLSEVKFKGWMFASSPALSALENSVYDISILACKKVDKQSKKSLSVLPNERMSTSN